MAIQITPLLSFDRDAIVPQSVDEVVDSIRLDVPCTVRFAWQAERVLVRLGMTETQARQRMRFCVGEPT